ncbi:NADH-quinone oxidoreductase subunit L [Pinibacter soli]|uniref:NADH-quinone oxidoreductase subunit L n=1 Tax=Pinibacter soli TaxID=3044211 RepID=A0ABT6R6H8_9BACT|nr:NADH-quinone oxidoreductase subunit L [Pinibacter soli]MDI3318173.1 NADH-quinone oxidoreductase subunit L [Pinibacter soli]
MNLIYLVPLFPLVGFLLNGLCRNYLNKSLVGIIGSGSILASFIVSLIVFFDVKAGHTGVVSYFEFINLGKFAIPFAFQVDQLSSLFLLIITGVGFLIHLYSTSYMHEEESQHFARYFAYLNLFVFSMLLLVLGANYVIMFIGWEGVGLCSYLLIGYWFKSIPYTNAANKAFIMNRIGDLGFLIAIFWIISKVGSVNYTDVFSSLNKFSTTDLVVITLLLFVGATGKSAQIPLYTWLPDAMAGPTPVSALIHAATMVTAGIYMIARSNILYSHAHVTMHIVAVIGLATAVFAATIALKQNDIKKVLAYSTVSQLGYMFLALGVGAYTGAVFHVMTHAFFKALLFLGSGSVIHAMGGEQDIRKMGGLGKYMPVTHITFLIGCLAIAGIPGFSGFFSKDEILAHTFSESPVMYCIGLFGALLTAFYMFRLYATTFKGSFRGTHDQEHHLHESPAAITIPLIILAVLAFAGGYVGIPEFIKPDAHALDNFLSPIFAESKKVLGNHPLEHNTEWMLTGISTLLIVIVVVTAWSKFAKKADVEDPQGFGKVLANKWYIDELYDAIIVKPVYGLGRFCNNVLEKLVDWIINGVGRSVQYGSRQLRLLQSGQVGSYVLFMIIGIVLFFVMQFFFKK